MIHYIASIMVFALLTRTAFAWTSHNILKFRRHSLKLSSSTEPVGRFNKEIELENPKVVTNISLKEGEKCVICRCWRSKKFPYCDGAHAK
jgi:hypothetical protein